MSAPYRVFGIRHHGPGSAASLAAALAEYEPDALLVEGPPEGDALIPLAAHPGMTPPVALLVYAEENAERAGFFPFAEFSPEWQALRHADAHAVPVRFFDLPQAHALALRRDEEVDDAGGSGADEAPDP